MFAILSSQRKIDKITFFIWDNLILLMKSHFYINNICKMQCLCASCDNDIIVNFKELII